MCHCYMTMPVEYIVNHVVDDVTMSKNNSIKLLDDTIKLCNIHAINSKTVSSFDVNLLSHDLVYDTDVPSQLLDSSLSSSGYTS